MPNYKMRISYDGGRYNGWERQGNTQNTIQGLFEFVLFKLLDENVEVIGSGRTDAGTHAKGQVANFHSKALLDEEEFLIKLNKALPKDIAVLSFEKADDRFHSRLNAKKKTYEYKIWLSPISNVFQRQYMFQSGTNVDIKKMEEASNYFLGQHDFRGFCSKGKHKKSTVRTIYDIKINLNENELSILITGNGFLYKMVRIITGTLIQVGEGKIQPSQIEAMLLEKDRQNAGVTLPSYGLTLLRVEY